MALLEVKKLGISFGGLRAVDEFSVKIEKGELYGLIGPNGAGKTTVFNLLTGVYKPTDGSIILDGEDITGRNTIQINHAGIARTFQNIRLFHNLSVIDNVKVGLHNHYKYSTAEAAKKAYETEPSIVNQMISYTDCFSYKESAKYRGARDAICGYLRYTYSNDWQEPLTGEQLINSGYIPSHFKELSSERSVEPVIINNQAYEIEISRDNVGGSYLITPHQSCSKEKNDGLISVWYTDYGSYENGQGPQEFICMYYDYHEDTNYAKLILTPKIPIPI